MYICVCNAVTDSDIRAAVGSGVRNMKQLGKATGCGSACGCCKEMATIELDKQMEAQSLFPMLQLARRSLAI